MFRREKQSDLTKNLINQVLFHPQLVQQVVKLLVELLKLLLVPLVHQVDEQRLVEALELAEVGEALKVSEVEVGEVLEVTEIEVGEAIGVQQLTVLEVLKLLQVPHLCVTVSPL